MFLTMRLRCAASRGTKFIATVPRRFVEGMTQMPAIKTLKAPTEVGGFRYVMIWHPRVNTDAAHSWLRAIMREVGASIRGHRQSKGNMGYFCQR